MALDVSSTKWNRYKNSSSPLLNEVIDLYKNDTVSPFWHKQGAPDAVYTGLNNITIPSAADIAQFQLKKIQDFLHVIASLNWWDFIDMIKTKRIIQILLH